MRHLQRFLSRTWEHSKRNNVSSCPFCELCPPAAILALSLVLLMNLTEDLWISQPLFYILLSVALLIVASTWPGRLFPPQLKACWKCSLRCGSGESSRRFQIQWSWQRGLIIAGSFCFPLLCVSGSVCSSGCWSAWHQLLFIKRVLLPYVCSIETFRDFWNRQRVNKLVLQVHVYFSEPKI